MALDFNGTSGNRNTTSKTLKRIEFEFQGETFKFLLNPEQYDQRENAKVTVTRTKLGAYLEAFGSDIIDISFSGITGFKNGTGDPESGYQQFKKLRDMIKLVYDNIEDGSEITDYLNFYNYTDNEYYVTYPDKFELSRSRNQPLLYKYSIHLYGLRRIGEPEPDIDGSIETNTLVNNAIPVEMTYKNTVESASSRRMSLETLISAIDPLRMFDVLNYGKKVRGAELISMLQSGKVVLESGNFIYLN